MTGHEQEYGGVGRDLRRARLACGQEVTGAAQALRINSGHLTALEEGRFGDLPAAVYVRGYIRAYAAYLNLDAEEMLRRVHQEHYAAAETEGLNFPAAPHELQPPGAGIMFYALLIVAAVLGAWYYLYGSYEEPEQQIAQPPVLDGVLPAAPAPPETLPGPPEQPANLSLTPSDEQEPVAPLIPSVDELVRPEIAVENGAGRAGQAEKLPQGSEESGSLSAGARGLDGAEGSVAAGEMVTEKQQESAGLPPSPPLLASPGATIATPPSGVLQSPVLLRATADTWMQVIRPDGTEVKSWVMRAGEEYVPSGEAGLSLTIGDAGALHLYLDGVDVSALGEKGKVIRELPLDAATLRVRFRR